MTPTTSNRQKQWTHLVALIVTLCLWAGCKDRTADELTSSLKNTSKTGLYQSTDAVDLNVDSNWGTGWISPKRFNTRGAGLDSRSRFARRRHLHLVGVSLRY
jgi:hypothetical protein